MVVKDFQGGYVNWTNVFCVLRSDYLHFDYFRVAGYRVRGFDCNDGSDRFFKLVEVTAGAFVICAYSSHW